MKATTEHGRTVTPTHHAPNMEEVAICLNCPLGSCRHGGEECPLRKHKQAKREATQ